MPGKDHRNDEQRTNEQHLARKFDAMAAKEHGVNVERLLVSQPGNAAQAVEIAETIARSGAVDVLFVLGELPAEDVARLRAAAARTETSLMYGSDH